MLGALQVDILIVICSCFAPTPSLASMVVNHFKMRTDVLSHNLSGMGCSSGVIGIDMARHYLQVILTFPGSNSLQALTGVIAFWPNQL